MFKLVVLSALIACSAAAPSKNHDHYAYAGPVATYAAAAPVLVQQEYVHVPAVAKVGEFVEHVPSSVSHHSSSVVHSSAAVATPVITPVTKTVIAAAPIETLQATPIVEEVREAQFVDTINPAPVFKQVHGASHDFIELRPEVHHVPALAKVGEFVEHVPSSVSHHSSSVVHSSAAVATPVITPVAKTIVAAAPVYKAAPVLKEVHASAHDFVEVHPQIYHAPALAKVGEIVEHVPSSVSHHSSSVVHSSAAIATPVITPVTKTIVAQAPVYREIPLLKTVHAPAAYAIQHQAPLYHSAPYAAYHHVPAHYHNEPLLHSW